MTEGLSRFEGLLGIALLLSVPVGLGVTAAVHVTTGRFRFGLLWGVTAFLAIFLLVFLGGTYGSVETGETGDVVTGVDADDRATGATPPAEAQPAKKVDLMLGAGVGALVTVLVWYIPGSPLLGGTVAGYLADGTDDDALRAAVLAGLLVPILVLVVASAAFVVAGAEVIGRFPFGPTVALGLAVVGLAYAVGFSAAGGRISVRIRE
ncbi:hypothetical protein BRC81_05200 [Halobacteriales archaeon QS_1_68_20]|nr:MAG: hypothetical protein BRC81_05200 [Halobacteriales archaeon QS_1_68_20]